MKIPDLIDILQEPTETKSILQKTNPLDFLTEENTKVTENTDFLNVEDPGEKEDENIVEEKQPVTEEDYKQNATMIVGTIDLLQTLSLPFLYQRSMFTKEERLRLKVLKKSQTDQGETTYSEDDLILLDKYNTFLELKENISFSEMESNALIDPLSTIMQKYKLSLGPEIMLFTALATVTLPRFLPILTPLEKL